MLQEILNLIDESEVSALKMTLDFLKKITKSMCLNTYNVIEYVNNNR